MAHRRIKQRVLPANEAAPDGIYRTLGNSVVCTALVKRLAANPRKFNRAMSVLTDFLIGMKTLAMLPESARKREELYKLWKEKYTKALSEFLTLEDGLSYACNFVHTKVKIVLES